MSFRNNEQLASVCQTICDLVGISSSLLWLPEGSTLWTRDILWSYRFGGSSLTLSWNDQVIFLLACSLWNTFCSNEKIRLPLDEPYYSTYTPDTRLRSGSVRFDNVIKTLNSKNLSAVGELFIAHSESAEAIDGWLQKFSVKKQPKTCPKCGQSIPCKYSLEVESPVSSMMEHVEYFTHKCKNCGFNETYSNCLASRSENELDGFDPVHIERSKSCPLCNPIV